jgi:hypothetical protein
LADLTGAGREFALDGYKNGEPLLDGKANGAAGADELLLVA